jgi:hypothetical protein
MVQTVIVPTQTVKICESLSLKSVVFRLHREGSNSTEKLSNRDLHHNNKTIVISLVLHFGEVLCKHLPSMVHVHRQVIPSLPCKQTPLHHINSPLSHPILPITPSSTSNHSPHCYSSSICQPHPSPSQPPCRPHSRPCPPHS